MNDDILSRINALPSEKQALLVQRIAQKESHRTENHHFDVIILGGGLAGLTLALQIKQTRPSASILVIERQPHPVPQTTHKVGESTVEIAAHYLRDILGLDAHLQEQHLRKFGLRMFFSAEGNHDIARRVEVGSTIFPPLSTYQIDRGRLENMLGERVRQHGIAFLNGAKVQQVALQPHAAYHMVEAQQGDVAHTMYGRWVVDATGRNALLRRQLGLAKKVAHHGNAVWFRLGFPIDVKTWSAEPSWHERVTQGDRALSTNHLMGDGYWVWLIRLASGSTSVGIVTDADKHPFDQINRFDRAMEWMRQHEPQCAAVIDQHLNAVQDFRVMKDYSYSCTQVFSQDRWCLTGEAALALDPLYSPGSDLVAISNGLVHDLVTRSLGGEDISALALVHDKLFLNLAQIWLGIYEQQYTLMNNPQIMVTKVIWDTAFYWGVFGLLYFHDAFRKIADSPSVAASLARAATLSNRIQAFYREWHAVATPEASNSFVDLYGALRFMQDLHEGMAADLPHEKLQAQFASNVDLLERIAGQIMRVVLEQCADQPSDAMLRQIVRWQTEPYIGELIARYRRDAKTYPIDSGWIVLGRPLWKEQEYAR